MPSDLGKLACRPTCVLACRHAGKIKQWSRPIGEAGPQMRTRSSIRIKTMWCLKCGTPLTVGVTTRKQPRCFECGIKEAIEASRQMREKRGPIYDKYLARWHAGMRHYLTTMPPPPSQHSSDS